MYLQVPKIGIDTQLDAVIPWNAVFYRKIPTEQSTPSLL